MKPMTVPAGLYPHQYDPIDTVGTWSFILARPGFDDAIGRRLAALLYRADRTGALSKHLAQSTAKNTLAAIPNPKVLQAGVAKYYSRAAAAHCCILRDATLRAAPQDEVITPQRHTS